jgi:ATP-dependent helicase/nuclease subunit B
MLYVQGIIDRIDTYEFQNKKYAKIIDYKTGEMNFDITKAYYGLSLQLPVYMNACMENMDNTGAAGVFYFRIRPPMAKLTKETDEDSLKELIRKNFQLKGITVKDLELIRAMDNNAEIGSFIGNVSVKKDGTLKENNSLIDAETFHALMNHTKENIARTAKQIIGGGISIAPYRYDGKETPCTYCKYKQFCKFSEGFGANKYRNIRRQKAQELFGKIKEERQNDAVEQPEAQ